MAHGVFFLAGGFGERTAPAVGDKEGVVAEAGRTAGSFEYMTFDGTVEISRGAVAFEEADCGAESRRALVGAEAGELFKEEAVVCLVVMVDSRESGRADAGGSAESVYFKAGVVGEAVVAIAVLDPSGLCEGISFERVGILGDVIETSGVAEAPEFHPSGEEPAQLRELMGVVGCDYYLFQVYK